MELFIHQLKKQLLQQKYIEILYLAAVHQIHQLLIIINFYKK
jgi:hypothetical protein